MRYLVDSSALARLYCRADLQELWGPLIELRQLRSCWVQRVEFLYSAQSAADYERLHDQLLDFYPDAPVHKGAPQWIERVQYQLAERGQHRSAGLVDLMIAATAAHHGLTVLHDDNDFASIAKFAPELREHNINTVPPDH